MADGTGAGPVPVVAGEASFVLADQAARLQGFVQAGGRAAILLCPSRAMRAALLDQMLADLPNHATRAGNPLASPLTLHRLLFQIGAGAGEGEGEDLLLRCLQERAGPAGLVVLAVDDAHTLAPEALAALAQVPGPAVREHPGRLLILAGHPDLLPRLSQPGLAALHDPAGVLVLRPEGTGEGGLEPAAVVEVPGSLASALTSSSPVPLPAPPAGGAAPGRVLVPRCAAAAEARPPIDLMVRRAGRLADWRRSKLPVLAAGAVGAAVLAALVLPWGGPAPGPAGPAPAAPVSVPTPVPAPASQDAAPASRDAAPVAGGAPGASAADAPAPEAQRFTPLPRPAAVPSDAGLRREFDAFLDRAGRDTASLSPANREALFREYLEWRGKGSSAGMGRTVP